MYEMNAAFEAVGGKIKLYENRCCGNRVTGSTKLRDGICRLHVACVFFFFFLEKTKSVLKHVSCADCPEIFFSFST